MMSGINSVCYKCPDRHEGCHADCEKYLEESSARMAEMAKNRKKLIANDFLWENTQKAVIRKQRKTKIIKHKK